MMNMKKFYFLSTVFLLFLLNACRYDTLPPMLPYGKMRPVCDTSAVIEYIPHANEQVNKEMLARLKSSGYHVQQGRSYLVSPPANSYILQVVDCRYTIYECKDADYLESGLIVMVRRPGIVLDEEMHTGKCRYFQAYSQLVYEGKQVYNSGIQLAIDHLFKTEDFRKALEPPSRLQLFVPPQNTDADSFWEASVFFQNEESYDFYQSLCWAFLAMFNGSADAVEYLAEHSVYGEIFTDKNLMLRLAKKTIGGYYRLGRIYEFGIGIPVNRQKAFEAYKEAALHEHPEALYALGRCHHYGIGTERSRSAAQYWYKKALDSQHPSAKKALDVLKDDDFDR